MVQWVKNLTAGAWVAFRGAGSIPSLTQWVKGSRVATAAAWIQSLAGELPHAADAATN